MKRKLPLTIGLIALCTTLWSQDYIPMLQETNSWNVVGYDGFTGNAYTYTFEITGEEVINDLTYKIVSQSDCPIREDGPLVYALNTNNNEEYLIYDFSLEIGETFQKDPSNFGCTFIQDADFYDFTVVDKTTEFIAGQDRRVLYMDYEGLIDETWIEGLGSSVGFYPFGAGIDSWSELSCFTTNGVTYFMNDYTKCIVLGVDDFNLSEVVLSPNPVSETSTLQFPQSGIVDRMEVFDISGRLVKEIPVESDRVNIHNSDYVTGIYFYRVFSENRLPKTAQFVVK